VVLLNIPAACGTFEYSRCLWYFWIFQLLRQLCVSSRCINCACSWYFLCGCKQLL